MSNGGHGSAAAGAGAADPVLELLKLEYKTAATRYNNIYESVWTIFSYLSAVSGAIVAFGPDKVRWDLLTVIAALPLLFWFWSTYLPLDEYGQHTLERLSAIETNFKNQYGAPVGFFSEFDKHRKKNFLGRAKPRIVMCFVLVHLVFAFAFWKAFNAHARGEQMFLKQSTATMPQAAPGR